MGWGYDETVKNYCPKVYKRIHRLNYYKLSDVVSFIETITGKK